MESSRVLVNEIYTAYAAILAYQIENLYKTGDYHDGKLEELVESFKSEDPLPETSHHLPSNLEYVDSFYDPGLSTSGVALIDTQTSSNAA